MKRERPADRGASGATGVVGDRQPEYTTGAAANTYRPCVGEIVEVHGLPGRFVVTATDDPSLITLANDQGVSLRVGERQVVRLEAAE